MDLKLTGRKAFISGSTKGIGLAIATSLAREGAHVVINGRNDASVAAALELIRGAVPDAVVEGFSGDLARAAESDRLIRQLPSLDILVNNLGIYEPKPFEAIPDEDWRRFFEVNVLSGVRLSRHFLGPMREKNWGRIVFISSESGLQIPAEMIHYGMTKTAQLAVARGLTKPPPERRSRSTPYSPDRPGSEGVEDFVGKLAAGRGVSREEVEREFFKTARPTSLLPRFITPEEIAAVVAFVCSPLAAAINGSAVRA